MLTESSNLTPEEVLKALKKNPATAGAFKREPSIDDPVAFFRTVKSILLGSQAARDFMSRHRIYIGHEDFALSPTETPARWRSEVSWMVDSLKQFSAAVARSKNGTLSPSARKDITSWVNAPAAIHVSDATRREIEALPDVRPERPIVLYRGMLFRRWQMQNDDSPKSAIKFLQALREKKRVIDMDFVQYSSWTTDLDVAERFARYSSASGPFQALIRGHNGEAIDGEMGVIVSALVHPKDILLNVSAVRALSANYGNESEYIVKPGKRLVRVVRLWNKNGEIDIDNHTNKAHQLIENLKKQHIDTTPFSGFPIYGYGDDKKIVSPKNISLVYKHADELYDRFDFTNTKIAIALKDVDVRSIDPEFTGLKELYTLDLDTPSRDVTAKIKSDISLRSIFINQDGNRFLAKIIGEDRSKAYHNMTEARQQLLFNELFTSIIKAAGKEKPENWKDVIRLGRSILILVYRLNELAARLNQRLGLLRESIGTVTEEELEEARKSFLNEDVTVSFEPNFPLKYVPDVDSKADWFFGKFTDSMRSDPEYCEDMHAKLMGNDNRPVMVFVDQNGDCRSIVDGNHRIGAALFRGESVIPAFVGRAHQLDEKAPPGIKAERFIRKAKADFKKRYGDQWEERLYSTAWKMFGSLR